MDLSDYRQRPSGLYDLYGYQIDNIAEKIVHDAYPDIDTNPRAVDMDEILEFTLGYHVDYLKLSPHGGILGAAIAERGVVPYVSDDGHPLLTEEPGNSALIDSRLVTSDNSNTRHVLRFVEGHEAGHLLLGKEYLRRSSNARLFTDEERKRHSHKPYWLMTDDEISEWQSNRLSAGMHLPTTSLTNEILNYFTKHSKVFMPRCRDMIIHVSELYDVSYSTAFYRLKGIEAFRLMYPKVYVIGDTNFY